MRLNAYSFYDVKAGVFSHPFYVVNDEVAMRNAEQMSKQEGVLQKYPKDFQLYRIGTFDDSAGLLTPEVPAFLLCGVDQLGGSNA